MFFTSVLETAPFKTPLHQYLARKSFPGGLKGAVSEYKVENLRFVLFKLLPIVFSGDESQADGSSHSRAPKTPKSKGRPTKNDAKKGKKQAAASEKPAAASERKSGRSSKHDHNAPDKNGEWEVINLFISVITRNQLFYCACCTDEN